MSLSETWDTGMGSLFKGLSLGLSRGIKRGDGDVLQFGSYGRDINHRDEAASAGVEGDGILEALEVGGEGEIRALRLEQRPVCGGGRREVGQKGGGRGEARGTVRVHDIVLEIFHIKYE